MLTSTSTWRGALCRAAVPLTSCCQTDGMRVRSLNFAQKVVVVAGLGFAFVAFGQWVTTRGSLTGWTGYAPLSGASFSQLGGLHPWVRLLIWLGLTLLWMLSSVFLLRSRPEPHNAAGETVEPV